MSLTTWKAASTYAKSAMVKPTVNPTTTPVAIANGGFEAGDAAWTKGAGWAILNIGVSAYSGNWIARYTGAGAETIATAVYPVSPGQVITGKVKARVFHATDGCTASLKWRTAGGVLISTSAGLESAVETGTWAQLTVTGSAPPTAATVEFAVVATRSVGTSVDIDDASWTYTAPQVASRFAYRAVQDSPGVSGAAEPVWPAAVGSRVTDGTVIWETVQLAYIVWEARPVIETGLTEPVWPTTVGSFVSDGTANWECVSRRVEDEKCPQSKVVAIMSSKVFAADRDIVRFSATANPLDWSSQDDAGYLPTGLQQSNANDMAVLQPYRGNLSAWNASVFQMWQADPDPSSMALLDQMDGVGSVHPLAAQGVANDLYYLSNQGVRSVGIANAAENMQAGDVGMPIDPLIQEAMLAAGDNKWISTYYPSAGQYWLTAGDNGPVPGGGLYLYCAPPDGYANEVYSYTYTATGGTAPYTYAVASGALPAGWTLDAATGVLSGTAAMAGTYTFAVTVTDALGSIAGCGGWSGGGSPPSDTVDVLVTYLLVTGSSPTAPDPMWSAAEAGATPTFVGIPLASGADIPEGTPAYLNGVWVVGGSYDARISTDNRATWQVLPNSRGQGQIAPAAGGWLLSAEGGGYARVGVASPITNGFAAYSFGTTLETPSSDTTICRYVGGNYWMDRGAQGQLIKTPTLGAAMLPLVYVRGNSYPRFDAFYDIEVDPAIPNVIYAAGYVQVSFVSERIQVRRSNDGGATWPDVLVDTATNAGDAPLQLQFGNGILIAHARGDAYVWTSADGFAASHATGIVGNRTSEPPTYAFRGIGRHIAYANGMFYCISGANLTTPSLGNQCVTTADGITFSSPASLNIASAYGIAAGDPKL